MKAIAKWFTCVGIAFHKSQGSPVPRPPQVPHKLHGSNRDQQHHRVMQGADGLPTRRAQRRRQAGGAKGIVMDDGWRKIAAGACSAWLLPADATCAGVARQVFRRTASALALGTEAIDDGETIVSELAANTLHAKCGQHSTGTCSIGKVNGHGSCHGLRAVRAAGEGADGVSAPGDIPPGGPELWLYLRGSGEHCELVCKVFDTCPGWTHGAPGADGRQ